MIALLLAATLQAAAPTAEAETLGRKLADSGTLAALLPMMVARDTEEMVAAHPELSATEKDALRAIARAQATTGMDRLLRANGHAFAASLSIDDLRTLVAAATSDAAKRERAALPKVIAATMAAAGGLDLKRDTLAAFCAKTGKACVERK